MLRRSLMERARPAAARLSHNLSRVGVALSRSGAPWHALKRVVAPSPTRSTVSPENSPFIRVKRQVSAETVSLAGLADEAGFAGLTGNWRRVTDSADYRRRQRIPCSGEYPLAHLVHDEGRVGFLNRKNSCPAGHCPTQGACSCAISPSCVRPPVYPIDAAVDRHCGPCPTSGPTKACATSCSRICRTSSSSYFSARYRETVIRRSVKLHNPARRFARSKSKVHGAAGGTAAGVRDPRRPINPRTPPRPEPAPAPEPAPPRTPRCSAMSASASARTSASNAISRRYPRVARGSRRPSRQ